MVRTIAGARIAMALLILAAVARLLWVEVEAGTLVPWDFFGYFTIQTNLIAAGTLLVGAPFTGHARPAWLEYLRACSAVYVVIVVAVYWPVLAPVSDDRWTWANLVVHGAVAAAMVGDWLVEGPRAPLPRAHLGALLAYPLAWCTIVLIRGATDGWVPYDFLHPGLGYGGIAVVIGAIGAAGVALGAALFRTPPGRAVSVARSRAVAPAR
ncbi:Pr6Pr family membrane protein [Demequina pelophila]|uniref:Pr6Pr family membrane protein n=1 Tax=Demequina pelophila TaxID=1638984 RepID=UPI0007860CCF|nr:Pr6Pr family membrane protein [Demequina pelophila]